MKEIIGSSNRVLEVDCTTREVRELAITDEERRLFLGGKGLALKYFSERVTAGIDPLGEKNILVFMMGVFLGSGAPCAGRFAALTKSPLTGIIGTASCGGPFGMAYKTACYDGLIIKGRAASPLILTIEEKGVSFEEAGPFWGMDTEEAQAALELGKMDGALVIGPAGENRVWYANIASGRRFLGRCGMGAVMGSKNLKAVVARGGAYTIRPQRADAFGRLKKEAIRRINANRITSHLFRDYGTAHNVNLANPAGVLPVLNFSRGWDPRADAVSGETMRERYRFKPSTCRPCTILCGHKGSYEDGVHQIPEYQTISLLGANLGIFDPDRITEWNDICGLMGMDTITAGGTLAWAMEAGERGLIRTKLEFGSAEHVSDTLGKIARREGFGDELANGSRWLSQRYGGREFAIQVKGLELPGYDPRGCWGQGLGYAVANRGGCHLSSYLYALEVQLGLLEPYTVRAKPLFTCFLENLYAAVNSLPACQFITYAFVLEDPLIRLIPRFIISRVMLYLPRFAIRMLNIGLFTRLFEAITGIRMPRREFLKIGRRIHTLERYLNCREGISRDDDTLPGRFLKEGRACDPEGRTVPLEPMLDRYYRLRGFDPGGIPKRRSLERLGLPLRRLQWPTCEILPGRKPLKRTYICALLIILGRALQAASRIDPEARALLARLPARFSFMLEVLPQGPRMFMARDERGGLRYRGGRLEGVEVGVRIMFKNLEAALLLFTFRESTARAFARDRMIVKGNLNRAVSVVRLLNIVEVYLLPKALARLALKRYPRWSPLRKHLGRLRIYFRTLLG